MNYNASVTDFFKSPVWGKNMMLGALALIIPIIGPIVLTGWHVTGLWARGNESDPAKFPAFDFQYFAKYLERGLWPFLVNLVASLVMVPLVMCTVFPLFILSGEFDGRGGNGSGLMFGMVFAGIVLLQICLTFAFQLIVVPLMLRATIVQDFKPSFDFGFVKDFLSKVWKELLVTMLFMFGVGLCLMVLAIVTCYIGAIFAAPVVLFAWHHLQKQLYQLHLARGGQAVPISPKLLDLPPSLPEA